MGIDLSQTYKIEKVGRCGGKFCIKYNDADYMLKFPSINEGIFEHGYSNNNTNTL